MNINADIYMNGQPVPVVLQNVDIPQGTPEIFRTEYVELLQRVQRLENRVTNHMGESMRADLSGLGELIYAIQRGQKIAAIKALRIMTPGMGLKEAKDAIESGWSSFYAENANRITRSDVRSDSEEPPF